VKAMLDTNICIYIIKRRPPEVLQKFLEYEVGELALSSVTVSELFYGAYKSLHVEKNLRTLERFLLPFDIVEYGYKAAMEYGRIRAELECQGKVIGGLDMQIAAHAKALDVPLVTNNLKEFCRVEGLVLENWVE
jgi:tRNA(fMet)-specific endonuclease VapC